MEKYETLELLGEGSFATVTKAQEIKTGETVAIKKLKKKYSSWQECVDLREVKSLNKLKHDNIIKVKEMIRVDDTLHLVFEYMERNLYELMTQRQNKKFNEGQIRCIMWQTLNGIAFMHKNGFFHRDLKPENLLVNGEKLKIADFGLAREIRSLPPYTDYVSTRWYRAPECILKSTNYNSPIDIWAMGCIMSEMYNFKPLFGGNSEKDVLSRMCAVIGTPTNTIWGEGVYMAKKIDLKFPTNIGVPLTQVVPDASKDAIDFLSEMLKWDPSKRATASQLLQHPFFTKFPIPTRITTPDYNISTTSTNSKTYTNTKNDFTKGTTIGKANNSEISYINKREDDDLSKMLDDTLGFNKFINKLKSEKDKMQEDNNYNYGMTNNIFTKDNTSPIVKNKDGEFDFEIDKYFTKENMGSRGYRNDSNINTIIDNTNNNSVMNMNISNFNTTNTNNQYQNSNYNYNKNFFDTTTLNAINNSNYNIKQEEKDKEDKYDFSNKSKISLKNKDMPNFDDNNNNNDILMKEKEKERTIERIENEIRPRIGKPPLASVNVNTKEIKKENNESEMDFDNCNVYLKNNNNNDDIGRPNSRKRSALKFLEDMTKDNNPSSIKSTKDPLNAILDSKPNTYKPPMAQNPIEKKPEYESRRKKPVSLFTENITDNKVDNFDMGFRKNNNFNMNKNQDMMIGNDNYKRNGIGGIIESRRGYGNNNNAFNNIPSNKLNKDKDGINKIKII